MESHRDDIDLITALQTLRPAPQPDFVAELDARADAGFPQHRGEGDSASGRISKRLRLGERLRIEPRRFLAPAGACAVLAIAAATAIVAVTESDPSSQSTATTSRPSDSAPTGTAVPAPAGAAAGQGGGSAELDRSAELSAPVEEFSEPLPRLSATSAASGRTTASGPYASQAERRAIERSAQLVLGTDPSEVRDDAAQVFETVHSYDGIVLRSSIRDGDSGEAGATFDLLIPTAKLGDALASFSEIAEVRSRHESTQDITAPTISVGERLQDAEAKVEGLLAQLASADTDAEREAVEAQLRRERLRVAALRSRLTTLQRRANLSHVSLRIETGTADNGGESDTGSWGVQDAVDDAGHILGIAAGITVIGLAIVAPLALIALLAWLAHRTWVRHDRNRALD
ncbi:MAG TPA: DUF4349 domain-containing protein [Solirubrobacterales bacterium]|jgi:hypothetical protein